MRKLFFISAFTMISVSPALAVDFQSPSGNIHCTVNGNTARCDIMNYKSSYNKPASCDGDYGQAFAVSDAGAGEVLCFTDSTYNANSDVLPYGQSVSGVGVSCLSRKDGMICTNQDGGGFHISRNNQRVF